VPTGDGLEAEGHPVEGDGDGADHAEGAVADTGSDTIRDEPDTGQVAGGGVEARRT